jgi:hypothetical protein
MTTAQQIAAAAALVPALLSALARVAWLRADRAEALRLGAAVVPGLEGRVERGCGPVRR